MRFHTLVALVSVSAIVASSLLLTVARNDAKGERSERAVFTTNPHIDVRDSRLDLSSCLEQYEKLKPKELDVHNTKQLEAFVSYAVQAAHNSSGSARIETFPLHLHAVVPVQDAPSLGFGLVIQLQASTGLQLESLSSTLYHIGYTSCVLTFLLLDHPSISWVVLVFGLRSDGMDFDAAVTVVFDRDTYRKLAWPTLLCTEPGQHHLFSATAYTISNELYSKLANIVPKEGP